MQARADGTRRRSGGGHDGGAGGVGAGAIQCGLKSTNQDAGTGFGQKIGGLVGGGNVGETDGAVADHLLAQPVELPVDVVQLLRGQR